MTDALANLDRAVQLLAEARTLDDIMSVRSMAAAAGEYARAERLGEDAVRHATEIKLRAARKAGELLIKMAENGERQFLGGDHRSQSPPDILKLADLGVGPAESSRWQRIAKVPEATFEEAVAERRSETAIAALTPGRERAPANHNGTCAHCEIHCPSGRYRNRR